MNDLDLDSSASLNGFPINKTDITWMGRKSPLCNRKDDTPIFDSVVYYVFGSVLGHQALVLKFKSGIFFHLSMSYQFLIRSLILILQGFMNM